MDISVIQPFLNWIEHNPALAGLVIYLVAAGESLALVGIVVPGIVFMLGVGTLVGLNAIGLGASLFWATIGAITGDWISYWLGRHFDRQLRHIWPLSRYPNLIPKGERFFKRHGGKSVLFGRFVGPLRPIIPAVAGIMHMPQWKFYAVNIVSAILWAPVVILPGVAFGESLQLANDVVMRLIAVIAVVIVAAGLLGYLLKALFSYALSTTVVTWMDYFEMRGAKENVVSLGLVGVLILSVILFVQYYEIRYQPLTTKSQATDFQWWQNNWQKFFLIHTRYDNQHPVSFQWWGTLGDIEQAVTVAGWQQASRLTAKNSLNYFVPDAQFNKLPIVDDKLFNHDEVLLMVAPHKEDNGFFVLRIWSANPKVKPSVPQLWLGSVHSVNVFSPLDMIKLPVPRRDYSQALTEFRQSLGKSHRRINIRKEFYQQLGISASWKGEVLLLYFNDDDRLTGNEGEDVAMAPYAVGRSGLSIRAPGPFTIKFEKPIVAKTNSTIQQGAYIYRHNGISLTVDYWNNQDEMLPLSEMVKQLDQQLRSAQNLDLQDIEEKRIDSGSLRGIQYRVHYQMPPFGKGLIYRINLLQQSGSRWLISASYKDCDVRGAQLVKSMLDSVVLPTAQLATDGITSVTLE